MSTITAPPRGFRVPVLVIVVTLVAAVITAAVVAFALNTGSGDDTPSPTSHAPAAQLAAYGSAAAAAEHAMSSTQVSDLARAQSADTARLQGQADLWAQQGSPNQDTGVVPPGRPFKDAEISDPGVPAAPGPGAGSKPRGADNYALR